jgi:hypothetical protein
MTALQEINPLLFLLLLSLLYLLFYLFKRNIKDSLILIAIISLSLLLFLPGGQAIAERTQYLKTPEERVKCLGKSIASGSLWSGKANNDAC